MMRAYKLIDCKNNKCIEYEKGFNDELFRLEKFDYNANTSKVDLIKVNQLDDALNGLETSLVGCECMMQQSIKNIQENPTKHYLPDTGEQDNIDRLKIEYKRLHKIVVETYKNGYLSPTLNNKLQNIYDRITVLIARNKLLVEQIACLKYGENYINLKPPVRKKVSSGMEYYRGK